MKRHLVIGVSGGPDSLALLHLLRALRGESARDTLHVAHLNHGFRGEEGEADARFVSDLAAEWGIPFTVRRFDVPAYARARKLSPEDAARRVRYAFLASLPRQRSATVAVAHTADDQAETVLMNILRGAGIGGLAGMRPLSEVPIANDDPLLADLLGLPLPEKATVYRPLLEVWRSEVEEYCRAHGLQPRTDASNLEATYRRNRVRNELIPYLEREYNPAIRSNLVTLAKLARTENETIEALVEREAAQLAEVEPGGNSVRLQRDDFARLPVALQRRFIRWAIEQLAGTLEGVTFRQVSEAADISAGEPGSPRAADLPRRLVVERHDGWAEIRRRGTTSVGRSGEEARWPVMPHGAELYVDVGQAIALDAGWTLATGVTEASNDANPPGELVAHFDWDALQRAGNPVLRTRRPGDKICPLGMEGCKSLQDLFVDAKIPRYLRDRLPLLSLPGGEVLWVPGPGGRRSNLAPVTPATRSTLYLEFTPLGDAKGDQHAAP